VQSSQITFVPTAENVHFINSFTYLSKISHLQCLSSSLGRILNTFLIYSGYVLFTLYDSYRALSFEHTQV
jgi:hypothetical protein